MKIIGFDDRFEVKVEKNEGMIRPKLEAVSEWVSDNTDKIAYGLYAGIIVVSFAWLNIYMKNIKLQNKLLKKLVDG